jgi:hypothetical protein
MNSRIAGRPLYSADGKMNFASYAKSLHQFSASRVVEEVRVERPRLVGFADAPQRSGGHLRAAASDCQAG